MNYTQTYKTALRAEAEYREVVRFNGEAHGRAVARTMQHLVGSLDGGDK